MKHKALFVTVAVLFAVDVVTTLLFQSMGVQEGNPVVFHTTFGQWLMFKAILLLLIYLRLQRRKANDPLWPYVTIVVIYVMVGVVNLIAIQQQAQVWAASLLP